MSGARVAVRSGGESREGSSSSLPAFDLGDRCIRPRLLRVVDRVPPRDSWRRSSTGVWRAAIGVGWAVSGGGGGGGSGGGGAAAAAAAAGTGGGGGGGGRHWWWRRALVARRAFGGTMWWQPPPPPPPTNVVGAGRRVRHDHRKDDAEQERHGLLLAAEREGWWAVVGGRAWRKVRPPASTSTSAHCPTSWREIEIERERERERVGVPAAYKRIASKSGWNGSSKGAPLFRPPIVAESLRPAGCNTGTCVPLRGVGEFGCSCIERRWT